MPKSKLGRNSQCDCNSGKKYKNCCIQNKSKNRSKNGIASKNEIAKMSANLLTNSLGGIVSSQIKQNDTSKLYRDAVHYAYYKNLSCPIDPSHITLQILPDIDLNTTDDPISKYYNHMKTKLSNTKPLQNIYNMDDNYDDLDLNTSTTTTIYITS